MSQRNLIRVLCAAVLVAANFASNVVAADKVPLKLDIPQPTLKGTPEQLPTGPNIEPNSDKAPESLMIAKDAKNVALGKPATSSVKPFTGELEQLTDGKKEAFDYDTVEMKKGTQWVQVDLGQSYTIQAVALWHDHRYIQAVHDVIVQVSDDPEFKTGVTTIFNNDTDNSSGQGVGTDREYFERHFGRVFDGKGAKGRYVRGYSKGSHLSALNCWEEIEVYAVPNEPKPKAAITTPTTTATIEPEPSAVPQSALPPVLATEVKPAETLAPQTVGKTATAPASIGVTAPSAVGDYSVKLLVGGIALLIVALGLLIYAMKRHPHVTPLAKAK